MDKNIGEGVTSDHAMNGIQETGNNETDVGIRRDILNGMGHILSEPVTEIESESYRSHKFTVGAAACQGWRTTMEDAHTVVPSLPDYPDTSYFAVFDGHGGTKTAVACSRRLHKYITDRDEFRTGNYAKAIQMGCMDMDEAIRHDSSVDDDSGSTANLVIIHGDEIYCGNVGDSRCMGMVSGRIVELSHDHKPTNNLEQSRIYNAGGWVEAGRVNGLLSLSRAFGDFNMKSNPNKAPKDQIVTAYPDIIKKKISDDWEFIVLACDGIWDVMSNMQVGSLVRSLLRKGKSPEDVCRETITKCRSPACGPRTLGCDNMTMILVAFNHQAGGKVTPSPSSVRGGGLVGVEEDRAMRGSTSLQPIAPNRSHLSVHSNPHINIPSNIIT